ncbi:UNVERIFIED_CONTAM: hypothetical protein RMT77_002511 [Armadillidium vulgare]
MTRIETIGIPLKKASEVDILKPLKNLITSRYQSSEQESYISAINEFSKLRNNTVCRILDYHESSLDSLTRYYDQLVALESKIPPTELQIAFKWKDAFDKGSIFGGRISLTLASLSYEKVCVLFNIAALQSQVAGAQSSDSDEALKLAAKLFQSASGIFNHLKTIVHASLQQDPTPDLQPETLTALSSLMLAQAQEVISLKARSDNMKDAVVAKLLSQCEELYGEALKNMQKEMLKPLWDRDWIPRIQGKQAGSQALAMYYQSRVCNANKSVGEEISRLKCAIELFKVAQSKSGDSSMFSEEISRAQRACDEAVKDNDFIYHERVPDVKSLPPIGKAAVAKQTPLPAHFSTNFTDLFESLVPVAIQQALAQYDVRKAEIVNDEVAKLRESTHLLNSILNSLNLPAAIEDTSGEKLPQSLREKSNAVCEKGGIKFLEKLLSELPELLKRNKELLDESVRQLKEEKESDDQLRLQFKERWTRTPSDKLTTAFQANAEKYRKVIETAIQADITIRNKYDTHKEGMSHLSDGPTALATYLPSASTSTSGSSSSPAVTKLRKLMEDVEAIKAERDVIESELKGGEIDMKEVFLTALAQDGAINEPALSVSSLGRVFGPLQKQVQESITRQESLVAEIQTAYNEFSGGSSSDSDRETKLKKLAGAHDNFMELLENLQEGTKFYNDLTQLLVNFQSKISDFCFARKTEKEELLKDLTSGLANQSVGTTPTPPSHHQEAFQSGSKSAPPRPPPPTPNPYQGAPQAPPPSYSSTPPSSAPPTGATPYNPPQGALPYPMNPQGMPAPQGGYQQYPGYPVYTPMPQGYNPYYTQPAQPYSNPPYPQQPYPGYPYPPQTPQQQWPPRS